MGPGTWKHTISMKLAKDRARYMGMFCGVVRDGAPCNQGHFKRASTVGWFIYSGNGGLYSNGKYCDEMAGEIESGQILTMQVDMDAGTLKF